jgi:regulatory protein YycI of two-component signal transduction system YycFG
LGFSVESTEGVRFLTRSRVFTDEEVNALAKTKDSLRVA